MGASAPVVRPFNAINGDELKKILLTEIQRQLDADTRFKTNTTYPQISWAWRLDVKMYPNEPGEFQVNLTEKTIRMDDKFDPSKVEPVEVSVTQERVVAAPYAGESADAVRRDAKIPVSTPRSVPGPGGTRQIVDAPALPVPKGDTQVSVGAVQENVEDGGRVFARKAVQRTNAAPEGIAAAPQAGSSPDIERVQEIMAQEPADGPPQE